VTTQNELLHLEAELGGAHLRFIIEVGQTAHPDEFPLRFLEPNNRVAPVDAGGVSTTLPGSQIADS
jgi:hypothetical protein